MNSRNRLYLASDVNLDLSAARGYYQAMENAIPVRGAPRASSGKRWFVAQTQARREQFAVVHLERQNFECYLPVIERPRRASGKLTVSREALFPGYTFVSFDPLRDRWRSINGTHGVIRLISFAEDPAPMPAGFVDSLRRRLSSNGFSEFERELTSGDNVRIVGSAFDDMTGTLLTARPQDRVIVLLDLLSGPRKVSLSRSHLVPA